MRRSFWTKSTKAFIKFDTIEFDENFKQARQARSGRAFLHADMVTATVITGGKYRGAHFRQLKTEDCERTTFFRPQRGRQLNSQTTITCLTASFKWYKVTEGELVRRIFLVAEAAGRSGLQGAKRPKRGRRTVQKESVRHSNRAGSRAWLQALPPAGACEGA